MNVGNEKSVYVMEVEIPEAKFTHGRAFEIEIEKAMKKGYGRITNFRKEIRCVHCQNKLG